MPPWFSGMPMTDVDIAGLGVWTENYSGWGEFCAALDGVISDTKPVLKPELIPPKERRRAPQPVKMAVEVMDQACRMAGLEPANVATVFASAVGDMQITDYMCRTLADAPRTISPTRFHNSVHNAATGYWSIATQSHCAAGAISGYANSAAVAMLDGAIQAVEEQMPVLVAVQEIAAPPPLDEIYTWPGPFAAAMLLTPPGYTSSAVASLRLQVVAGSVEELQVPEVAGVDLSGNPAASLLALFTSIEQQSDAELQFPLTRHSSLRATIVTGCQPTQAHS